MATVRLVVIFIQLFIINKIKGQSKAYFHYIKKNIILYKNFNLFFKAARITIMDDNLQFKNDNEGQSCLLSKGTSGTCEKPYNCMDALHSYIGNGVPLEFCSVNDDSQVSYICCEKTSKPILKFGTNIELKESISQQS